VSLPGAAVLVPPALRPGRELLAEGQALARDWWVGRTPFLMAAGVACEADYKRAMAARGRIMQHAHIGFRSVERTVGAIAEVHETCARRGVTVDRFGITLDWSMGYPATDRAGRGRGTGIVLNGPEDFARITCATTAAAHFGDFMLGLPGALDNTKHALAAGATAIGNLGQYFTFRLPDWDDDIATTEATVTALGLIAAQDVEILVHSNLDDGFAGLFADMSATLGMVLIEKHIVEALIGARTSHCFGHHFTAPGLRLAFHRALAAITDGPGTMIFGNTVSYRSTPGGNFASLSNYLQADIWALRRQHTGHAINPVPVTENERIPDVDEIIEAQTFACRLVEHASESLGLVSFGQVDRDAEALAEGARVFAGRVLNGLDEAGVDTTDPAALMIALRRNGPGGSKRYTDRVFPIPLAGAGGGPSFRPSGWRNCAAPPRAGPSGPPLKRGRVYAPAASKAASAPAMSTSTARCSSTKCWPNSASTSSTAGRRPTQETSSRARLREAPMLSRSAPIMGSRCATLVRSGMRWLAPASLCRSASAVGSIRFPTTAIPVCPSMWRARSRRLAYSPVRPRNG
jgi:hypothetical protein